MEPVAALGAGIAFVCWADRDMSGTQLAGLAVVFVVLWGCALTNSALDRQMSRLNRLSDKSMMKEAGVVTRHSALSENTPEQTQLEHPDGPPADPYLFAYTNTALQERRDDFVFRKQHMHHTTESRQRVLAQMYKELLDSSKKTDPGLRAMKHSGTDGCQPLSGSHLRSTI